MLNLTLQAHRKAVLLALRIPVYSILNYFVTYTLMHVVKIDINLPLWYVMNFGPLVPV